jgi:hypothetical protein
MPQPETDPPTIPPGLYRLNERGRLWSHDELTVIWVAGLGWAVVPRVALAALPVPTARPSYDSEAW